MVAPTFVIRAPKNGPAPRPDHTCFTRLPSTSTLRQFARRGSRQKNAGPPPQPDHTSSARLPTSTMSDSLGLGPAQENDPWRFRQQSSRVISIQFWYLTSLVTSLSVGSDPDVSQWLFCKTCIFRRIFSGLGWLLLSWEPCVYLYIGITSLYLYNSIRFGLFQDGIFHKSTAKLVCKTQIPEFFPISR